MLREAALVVNVLVQFDNSQIDKNVVPSLDGMVKAMTLKPPPRAHETHPVRAPSVLA